MRPATCVGTIPLYRRTLLKKRLSDMGAVVTPLKSKEFGDYIRSEIVKWGDIVNKAGVKPE